MDYIISIKRGISTETYHTSDVTIVGGILYFDDKRIDLNDVVALVIGGENLNYGK